MALLLSQTTPANAVTINSETAPGVTGTSGNGATSLLNAQEGNAITLQIPASEPDDNGGPWRFGLTSGRVAHDKNLMLIEFPANLLIAKRDRRGSPGGGAQVDFYHSIAMEDLTGAETFIPPVQLVILTTGGTAMLFLSLALFYRLAQRPRGKRVRFGILWNAYKPICGRCQSRLTVLNDYSFQCPSCQVELGARGDNGKTISPREALLMIRRKEYW